MRTSHVLHTAITLSINWWINSLMAWWIQLLFTNCWYFNLEQNIRSQNKYFPLRWSAVKVPLFSRTINDFFVRLLVSADWWHHSSKLMMEEFLLRFHTEKNTTREIFIDAFTHRRALSLSSQQLCDQHWPYCYLSHPSHLSQLSHLTDVQCVTSWWFSLCSLAVTERLFMIIRVSQDEWNLKDQFPW